MALSVASPSTNSTPLRKWKYEVFLSFRGADTRFGFTDHLYNGLKNKGIVTFRDKEGLERGELISEELFKAIEESLCAIVILSQNYASSTWCLKELKKILESKNNLGQHVLPIFYGVEPSDVKRQKGSFAEAFKIHERRFKDDKQQVQNWRGALTQVADLAGLSSINCYETELIENIAETVCAKLLRRLSFSFDGLVGIGSKVAEMKSLLEMGLEDDVCFVGIWGMGGVGKTTLASVVYEGIRDEFETSCFIANVREVSEKYGLAHLQKELLSPLIEIKNEYEGREKIRHFLSHMKVLIVLDDVSDKRQLDNLVGKHEWFGKGSRVIVTTRDKHLLTPKRLFKNYDIEMLSSDESLKLLCVNAFHNDQPEDGFLDISKGICNLCGGLPLALEVMGSFLCERSVFEWQDALNRMEQNVGDGDVILKTLQISYDGLRKGDRAIFLDIACFFNNMEENMLRTFLKDRGLNSILGLNMLLEKSLVSYNKTRIRMHDMLVQLGKTMVLDESYDDAGKRSRLWSQKDIDKVMGENEGGKEIQGIVFTSPKPYQADWDENCFAEMKGLRLLVLQNVHLLHGLRSLPSALKVLVWEGYAMNALPHIAQSNELVSLMLPCSKLSQLWNNTQVLGKLRVMDLRHSKDLTTTPEFDRIPNLESLILEGCVSLDQVHESFGNHKKLVKVDFTGCKNLMTLPSKLWMNSLETLILTGCIKLENLPEFDENMQSHQCFT
ncbi:hypothetical protein TanjilG_19082 [Lupinus angustifolius]|uniref:TIR domain-containing protein n=2 Tax=Lupinus angustifolius TaxID=3871 RepID=A0A4P1RRT3_LUPAN|nr:hypothetical protein TanjilG_19082 [Lupinus angustifolius]